MYGLNNMPARIPSLDLFPDVGRHEGSVGVTYEVVGSPAKPVINVNPISAVMPGVLRKFMEFRTGNQNNPGEFPSPNSPSNN
jgi:hypothetical protein